MCRSVVWPRHFLKQRFARLRARLHDPGTLGGSRVGLMLACAPQRSGCPGSEPPGEGSGRIC